MMTIRTAALHHTLRWIIVVRLTAAVLASISAAACDDVRESAATTATHPSLRIADLPPLIPAKEFYITPDSWGHQISPNGARLAWIKWLNGKPTIHFRLLDSRDTMIVDHPFPVTQYYWAADSIHLIFFRNWRILVADTRSPKIRPQDLTPFHDASVQWYARLPTKSDSVLVQMKLRDGQYADLYEIDLRTGLHKLIQRNDGETMHWFVDAAGNGVGRVNRATDGGWYLQALSGRGGWKTILTGKLTDRLYPAVAVRDSNSKVYTLTNAGRDKIVVAALDWKSGEQETIFERPDVDVAQLWTDPLNHRPLAVKYHDPYPHYHFFDTELQDDLETILGPGPIVYRLTSTSVDFMRLTIETQTDRLGPRTYLVDRQSEKKELLSSHPVNKHAQSLSETRPIRFSARDGLPISGYLTLPNGAAGKRLPTVLKVHGGPWRQDLWGFDIDTQFLANRGYAVLEVNYRGSVGFGKVFLEKARKKSGHKIQDDLIDAADWAITEGYTDPDNIAIFGHSYGGYAALLALTRAPMKFAAGIDVMGPTDLALQVNTFHKGRNRAWWIHFFGDPDDPDEHSDLMEHSPINHANSIQRPLLIVHGAKDSIVSKEHSDRLVDKLRENNIPVEYLVFPDEGHNILKRRNLLKLAYRIEAFLAKQLGGRAGTAD